MNIYITRIDETEERILGTLSMPGFSCHTLEDDSDKVKTRGDTAIPAGTYEVVVSFSNRFQKMLPLLLKVPNFEGVRIHSGNTADHTEGCILLGMGKTENSVTESRKAMSQFMPLLMKALKAEKVYVQIS